MNDIRLKQKKPNKLLLTLGLVGQPSMPDINLTPEGLSNPMMSAQTLAWKDIASVEIMEGPIQLLMLNLKDKARSHYTFTELNNGLVEKTKAFNLPPVDTFLTLHRYEGATLQECLTYARAHMSA